MAKKVFFMSARIVAIVAAIGIIYGFITRSVFVYTYVFSANFRVGAVILLGGLLVFITPTAFSIKKNRLLDHTTYGARFMEERERKRKRASWLILIGLCNIVITGTVQLVVWFVF